MDDFVEDLLLIIKAILFSVPAVGLSLGLIFLIDQCGAEDRCHDRWRDSGYHVRLTQTGVCQVQQGEVWIPESAIKIQPR